jgi:hypothetical protein
MSASVSGKCADARQLPVAASTTEALMDEVPKSIPNNNITELSKLQNTCLSAT